ncbi:response regulator transcription factor [Streptomyces sp. L7]
MSRREREIALLVGPGLTNQEIATRLNLSVKTVETYMGRIFKKMGAKSRAHVAFLMSEPTAGGTRN